MMEIDPQQYISSMWYAQSQPPTSHPYQLERVIHAKPPTPFHTAVFFPWSESSLYNLSFDNCSKEETEVIIHKARKMVRKWTGYVAVGGDDVIYLWDLGTKDRLTVGANTSGGGGGETKGQGKGKERDTGEEEVNRPPPSMIISIPSSKGMEAPDRPIKCITWAFTKEQVPSPLLVYTRKTRIYIINIQEYLTRRSPSVRFLKAHGELITSIHTSPARPFLILTTSRDHTTRIWDISPVIRPSHPPTTSTADSNNATRSLRSRAAKMAAGTKGKAPATLSGGGGPVNMELESPGRCWRVLAGGSPAGHMDTVLCAAWHPRLPIVATGGVDRTIKIWNLNLPPDEDNAEPIFSTALLHKARVMSISWLSDDILATHSAPTWIQDPDVPKRLREESMTCIRIPGELMIWKWLSMGRFFPSSTDEGREKKGDDMDVDSEKRKEYPTVLRGSEQDYRDSLSFTKLAVLPLPLSSPASLSLHTYNYNSPYNPVPPLFLIPFSEARATTTKDGSSTVSVPSSIRLIPAWKLPPNKLGPLPLRKPEDELGEREGSGDTDSIGDMTKQTDKMRLASRSAASTPVASTPTSGTPMVMSREASAAMSGSSRSGSTTTPRDGANIAKPGKPWHRDLGWELKWDAAMRPRIGGVKSDVEDKGGLRIGGVAMGLDGEVIVAATEDGLRIWRKAK